MTSIYSPAGYGCGGAHGGGDNPVSSGMVRVLPQRGIGLEPEQRDYERLVEAAVAAAEAEDDEADRRVPQKPSGGCGGGGGGGLVARDEWSDCATRALLASWGERHLGLARGGLKLCDWAEVAKVVSSCSPSPKTGVQCKNRVDTLKKKFKSERQKQLVSPGRSKWPFYAALERLLSMARDRDRDRDQQQPGVAMFDDLPRNHQGRQTEDAEFASSSMENASSWEERRRSKKARLGRSKKRKLETEEEEEEEEEEESEEQQIKELSDAIAGFGEIYERFESSKQQQMADLERARMEFARDLELHRMQLLMQAQMEVARLRHLQQQDEEEEEEEEEEDGVLAGINLERTTTNF